MTNRKIIHQVTRRSMAGNPRRTLVSLLGVLLMVTLMTCVFVGKDTALGYLTDRSEASFGKWHLALGDLDREQLDQLRQMDFILDAAPWENQGYTLFPQSGQADHPYLNLRRYSSNAFDWMNIQLTQGRLPAAEDEVVLSTAALEGGAEIAIGDQITADCFRRYLENFGTWSTTFPFLQFTLEGGQTKEAPASFGYFLPGDPFYETHREIHQPTSFSRTYTVVGFIQPPSYENAGAAAYTALTWLDEASLAGDTFRCLAVTDVNKLPSNAAAFLQEALGVEEVQTNDQVLAFSGLSSDSTVNFLVQMAQAFFTLLILLVSVILIYNVFNLSYDERCRYLGMLSSVGATGRQKRSSVYYEAGVLLLPALPLGFLLGLGVVLGGMHLLAPLAGQLLDTPLAVEDIPIRLVLRPLSVVLALGLSGATVFLSALLPARRMGKIGPVESIRRGSGAGTAGHKLRPKTIARLGGEGMLARGFLTHQKEKTRGILRALAAFLIILVVTVYGGQTLCQMVSYKLEDTVTCNIKDQGDHDYLLMLDTHTPDWETLLQELGDTPGITGLQATATNMWSGETEKTVYSQAYWDAFSAICSLYYPQGISQEEIQERYIAVTPSTVNLLSVEDATFQAMLTAVGGDPAPGAGEDPCILFRTGEVSTDSLRFETYKPTEYRFYQVDPMSTLTLGETLPLSLQSMSGEQDPFSLPLTVAGFGDNKTLAPWLTIHSHQLWAITPFETTQKILDHFGDQDTNFDFTVYFNADETIPQAQAKLQQLGEMDGLYFSTTGTSLPTTISSVLTAMVRVLMTAFIVISSLLCYLNLYNAISGLMIARRKDFAILRSNGMTRSQLWKMCRYELTALVLRSLALAVPVSALLCWGINTVFVGRFGHFIVSFPALPVAALVLLSLAVVFIMEHRCCARENRGALMEELKRDSL